MSRDINNKFWDEELETLPREELEKRQLEDLKEIAKFAYENAPYYKRSFDEAGVKPDDIKTLKGGGRGIHFHLVRFNGSSHHEPVHQEGF